MSDITLSDALLDSGMTVNLLSVNKNVVHSGLTIIIEKNTMEFRLKNEIAMVAKYASFHQLFILDGVTNLLKIVDNKCFLAQVASSL